MGGGGCVYAPVASLPCKICSVLLKSVDRPAWLTTANSFSELNPDQIIFLWLPLYCDNRDGFEYYTTRQLQYTIRSGFFLRILSCWKRKSLSVKWMLMVGLLFIINWQTPLNLCLWNYLQLLPRLFFLSFLQWLVLTFFNLLQNALRFLVISPHFLPITKTILRLERSRKRLTVLVTMSQSKWKKCRFIEIKNGLLLSQNVTPFLSVFVGCWFIKTRLSPVFFSTVTCHQYPLEGLITNVTIIRLRIYESHIFELRIKKWMKVILEVMCTT